MQHRKFEYSLEHSDGHIWDITVDGITYVTNHGVGRVVDDCTTSHMERARLYKEQFGDDVDGKLYFVTDVMLYDGMALILDGDSIESAIPIGNVKEITFAGDFRLSDLV